MWSAVIIKKSEQTCQRDEAILVQSVTNPAFRDSIENQANVCVFAVGFDRIPFETAI